MTTEDRVTDPEWGQDIRPADQEASRVARSLGFVVNTPPSIKEDHES